MRVGAAAVNVGISFVLIFGTISITPRAALALPAFAQQTGQPCGRCHNAFPELTAFGRRFKLGGYTLGGGEERALRLSVMGIGGFTHTEAPQVPPPPGFQSNDNLS